MPLEENATPQIPSVCILSGPMRGFPLCASYTRMVPSLEPETICFPSRENAAHQMLSVCPRIVRLSGVDGREGAVSGVGRAMEVLSSNERGEASCVCQMTGAVWSK
jgi:hypothetical protein